MRMLMSKVIGFLIVWYEVTAELGLSGGSAFAVTLLVCGGLLMALRMPGQVMSLLGPRVMTLFGPALVWLGLACWLMPGPVMAYPVFWLLVGGLLAVCGAGLRYLATRHPQRVAPHIPMMRGALVPGSGLLLGLSQLLPGGLIGTAVLVGLVALPLRMGWRFIGAVPPPRFDARMGDGASFHDAGYREEP